MTYVRVFTDSMGETHFEDIEATFSLFDYAPPAPPFYTSPLQPALYQGFIRIPVGWQGDWHPAPRRQWQIFLKGQIEVQVSDGEVRRAGPGVAVLVEDTSGKGHTSRVVSDEEVVILVIILPEKA